MRNRLTRGRGWRLWRVRRSVEDFQVHQGKRSGNSISYKITLMYGKKTAQKEEVLATYYHTPHLSVEHSSYLVTTPLGRQLGLHLNSGQPLMNVMPEICKALRFSKQGTIEAMQKALHALAPSPSDLEAVA